MGRLQREWQSSGRKHQPLPASGQHSHRTASEERRGGIRGPGDVAGPERGADELEQQRTAAAIAEFRASLQMSPPHLPQSAAAAPSANRSSGTVGSQCTNSNRNGGDCGISCTAVIRIGNATAAAQANQTKAPSADSRSSDCNHSQIRRTSSVTAVEAARAKATKTGVVLVSPPCTVNVMNLIEPDTALG